MAVRLKARERREGILRAAMDLFARRGFAGVTTREVARAAGISEAMLFKHFPHKRDLYRSILERHVGDMERAMPIAGLEGSAEPPARFFGGIAGTILRRIDGDPTLLRLMFFSALEGHPLARDMERARARDLRGAIEEYLRRGRRSGRFRGVDEALAARSFLWLVVGFGISRVLFREPGARSVPRGRLVRAIVDQFLAGVRPAGRPRRRAS